MDQESAMLSRDAILAMDDIPVEEVIVPEWKNQTVLVCGLTAAAKNAYQASLLEIEGEKSKVRLENSTAKLLQKCLVNRQRQPLFQEGDILALGTKSAKVLGRLAKVAERLSGMDGVENETFVKNFGAAQSGDSPTVSL